MKGARSASSTPAVARSTPADSPAVILFMLTCPYLYDLETVTHLALFPKQGDNYIRSEFFEESPSVLLDLVPSAEKWQDCVKVIDPRNSTMDGAPARLSADAVEQKVICYFER